MELEEAMKLEFFPVSPSPASTQQKRRYIYRPFETKDSIRLFRLEPGVRGELIKGHLLHVSIASNTEYEALSYAWGSPAMHHELHTDEGTVPITASLRSALTSHSVSGSFSSLVGRCRLHKSSR
jgi:hypothetical protein